MASVTLETSTLNIDAVNRQLADTDALSIVEWTAKTFGNGLVMSTSFGIQSALMLHLVTRVVPDIPVIWVDTGYLPPKTYRFAEQLTARLNLNLKVYQSLISPARMEALYGRLWTQDDIEGMVAEASRSIDHYNQMRKVEPMHRALRELQATAWLAGLRTEQTNHRKTLRRFDIQSGIYKVLPILHWSTQDVDEYFKVHNLPYHPLRELGYATVGDWHSSRPVTAADQHERDTRFGGIKQECGLHLPQTQGEAESLNSSSL
ncbi:MULTISPECIES: phosphoadenylyl-sulfate reductase [unclassified Coleofasciculus]|uniref:phosphoadenylyl-sulfate reductase n=1 Tax=unclassified Coleofasciculus TaxID=2692782 RepID=UPI00187E7694|nr:MULTISPECIES: phosphoadenylyl-sulfate reductase [unclassified Coleofasciculus]MBE9124644.1 phosphoadenylyl-sulfate reductase [Coleofasciculus sp. LEGE 07081]MBE9147608.1 phosphoadenylyl-sulfate reductase [Coleofasciculus sp. LEGE 07092]